MATPSVGKDRLSVLKDDIESHGSLLEKMVALSRMRDESSGIYRSPGTAGRPIAEEEHKLLLSLHETIFHRWLQLPIQAQLEDLENFLSAFTSRRQAIVQSWLNLQYYRVFVPPSAAISEKALFITAMEVMLRMSGGGGDRAG